VISLAETESSPAERGSFSPKEDVRTFSSLKGREKLSLALSRKKKASVSRRRGKESLSYLRGLSSREKAQALTL